MNLQIIQRVDNERCRNFVKLKNIAFDNLNIALTIGLSEDVKIDMDPQILILFLFLFF